MVESYDFYSPPAIVFGWGRLAEIGSLAAQYGQRAFLVCGSRTLESNGVINRLERLLAEAGIESQILSTISREPLVEDVDRLRILLREASASAGDLIIGIGGGAAIDLAKAAAAMATNQEGESVRDYLEGVGRGLALRRPPLPVVAIPTTAGTGAEATRNAVISQLEPPFKKSLRSALMIPRLALVDPELTVSAPPAVTAYSGMDAITQLIESAISSRARPIPRALCRHGLELALPSIRQAFENGTDREAREAMAHAALLSGLALANSGLGMAHGVAAALGVHANVPHGLACAMLLPVTLRTNRQSSLDELAVLGRSLTKRVTQNTEAAADALIEGVEHLTAELGIPRRLSEVGVRREQLPAIVAGSRGNSMSGNPRSIDDSELRDILESIW